MRPVRYRRSKYWWAASVFRVLKPIWRHAWTFLTIATIIFFIAAWGHTWSTQPWRPYWTPYVQKGWEGKQWDKNIYASVEDETGATSYRCSMVAGTAFFQAVGVDLSPYVGDLLILTDSTGKQAYGYIKAAGGGETLGAEKCTNGDMESGGTGGDFNGGAEIDDGTSDTFTNWTNESVNDGLGNKSEATATVHGGSVAVKQTRTTAVARPLKLMTGLTTGGVYKLNAWVRGNGTVGPYYYIYDADNNVYMVVSAELNKTVTYGEVSKYITLPSGCTRIRFAFAPSAVGGVTYGDDYSFKQVTDCATTGVRIVSTPNGSTQNWASITSGFNPNDAAMTFDIYETGNLP